MATGPLSLLTQETKTLLPFGPFLRSSMMLRGQAFTQAPQEVHLSSSTSGIPVSGLTLMASNLQAASQSPQPRHPKPQAVSPAPQACMAAQVRRPAYSAMRGRCSHVPLHLTTATIGSVLAIAIPSRSATFPMVSAPPTGHISPSRLPASAPFTRASAIPLHPGNPHPPQLAPGSNSPTCAIRGSSYTANFLEAANSTTAAIRPIAPKTITAIKMKFIML